MLVVLCWTEMTPRFFPTSAAFRQWLKAEGHKTAELWVGYYKKTSSKPSITYSESVDQALCFGWIDGVRHSIDAHAYAVRFTPRKPRSQWSAVNIKRVQKLTQSGKMTSFGLKAFEGAESQERKYSFERHESHFNKEAECRFRADRAAWQFFQSQPPWYRRTATFWVVSAKKDETRQKRLATLIDDSAHGRTIKPLTRPVPKRQQKRQ